MADVDAKINLGLFLIETAFFFSKYFYGGQGLYLEVNMYITMNCVTLG